MSASGSFNCFLSVFSVSSSMIFSVVDTPMSASNSWVSISSNNSSSMTFLPLIKFSKPSVKLSFVFYRPAPSLSIHDFRSAVDSLFLFFFRKLNMCFTFYALIQAMILSDCRCYWSNLLIAFPIIYNVN